MGGFRPYKDVIVRPIPLNFDTIPEAEGKNLSLEIAEAQHDAYVRALRKAGARVHYLPRNDHPESVFVEDVAIIIHDRVLLTEHEHVSRRNETPEDLVEIFEDKYKLKVSEVFDEDALIDGGDVIYTGKEIIAALSPRTNNLGIEALKTTFPFHQVVTVQISGDQHLTAILGLFGEDTFCVSRESPDGRAVLAQINDRSDIMYQMVEVPDDLAVNCIAINNRIICKSAKESPESFAIMDKTAINRKLIGVELSEIEKALGSLTCMSLRFNSRETGCCPVL